MLYDRYMVQCVILSLSQYGYNALPTKKLLLDSISWLYENYKRTKDRTLLIKAVNHAYAFLKMGYDYESGKKVFEPIVDLLEMSMEEVFPAKEWVYTKKPLQKNAIRGLLGRWNPNLQSMKIGDVVQDIYDNIQYHRVGEYLYYSGRVLCSDKEKMLWERTFRLYITENENVLYDVTQNIYYAFEGGN